MIEEPKTAVRTPRRVCVLGAESTGSTTLAQHLAALYREPLVAEYAREYTHDNERHGDTGWTSDEILGIAQEQARREDAAIDRAQRLLICDTDAFTVAMWHEGWLGRRDSSIESLAEERRAGQAAVDLYLLTAPDFPYEHDRVRSGEHNRYAMHDWFVRRLTESGRPWVLLTGDIEHRVSAARAAIAERLGIVVE